MKRLWVILGALAVFCALSVTSAFAGQNVGVSWMVEPVQFRTHKAALGPNNGAHGVDALGGYVDSVSFNRASATGATLTVAFAETTTAISTQGWAIVPSGVLPDSAVTFVVTLNDAGATAAAVDTVHIAVQVSADGTNWIYAAPLANGIGVNPITASTPLGAAMWSSPNAAGLTTTTPKVFSKKFVHAVASTGQYPDPATIHLWPFIRFIIVNDNSGGVITNLKCQVGHWTAKAEN